MTSTTLIRDPGKAPGESPRFLRVYCVFTQGRVIQPPHLVTSGRDVTIGRSSPIGLSLLQEDNSMSRLHFQLHYSAQGLMVDDLGSSNGTWVNRRKVSRTDLYNGDVIRSGESLFLVLDHSINPYGNRPESNMFTISSEVSRIFEKAESVAPTDISLLLLGETGTGKDVLAEHIHHRSRRRGPYIPINCTAIPEQLMESTMFGHVKGAFTGADSSYMGMIRAASSGTLFLDEIGDMPLGLQTRLLRVLETRKVAPVGGLTEHEVDIRVLAATSKSREELDAGALRNDLRGRLQDLVLTLPPLRHRREDILPLAAMFLNLPEDGILCGGDVAEAMVTYDWPWNIRELKRTVKSAIALNQGGSRLTWDCLKPEITTPSIPSSTVIRESRTPPPQPAPSAAQGPKGMPTREALLAVMEANNWNISEVARHYNKDRRQIYRWLEKYQISSER